MLKLFKIEGSSLHPILKEGEVILCLKIYSFSNIKINDIVVFSHKTEGLMIKRVTNISSDSYYVQGESPYSIDSRNFGKLKKSQLLYKKILTF